MSKLYARALVILKAAPTYLVALSTVVTIVADEIDAVGDAGRWAVTAVAWLGAAVAIIRRVTPVLPDERGILPPAA